MISRIFSMFLTVVIFFLMVGCQDDSTLNWPERYGRLCEIYEEYAYKSMDVGMREGRIVEKVQAEMPEYYEETFRYIVSMDSNRRYPTIKRLAEEQLGESWDCEVMRSYYETQFSNESDSQE